MNRREILQYTAYLTGASLSAPLVSAFLSGCDTTGENAKIVLKLKYFKPDEYDFLKECMEVMLPKTDSPSALDLGVDKKIDAMIAEVYKEDGRNGFRANFQALMNFVDGQDAMHTAFMKIENGPEVVNDNVKEAYHSIKGLGIAFYMSTELISKEFLNYLPVPGAYEACIPVEAVGGKAWAI